ncbi:MAG TPA: hypothetical protein VJS92_07050 [Candidatus Polarisedimenticolaceae bacterium]|nr:hypothetical protein [Candidatus Polarisedimenticolaceae bacterium]
MDRLWPKLCGLAFCAALTHAGESHSDGGVQAYRAMGVEPKDVLSGTVLTSRVVPGGDKQIVAMASFLTGRQDEASAVGVRLCVFRRDGEQLVQVYRRDLAEENGGFVGEGNVELIDFDQDGVNEIVLSFKSFKEATIEERRGEVLLYDESGFKPVWSGSLSYDGTRAVRKLAEDRRDRFTREIDLPATLGTRGVTLIFNKKVTAIAGERLAQPKVVRETFPLKPQGSGG